MPNVRVNSSTSAAEAATLLVSPDLTGALQRTTAQALVIHCEADTLVDVSGAHATVEAIPGAALLTLPLALWSQITAAITAHAYAADKRK